MYVAQEVGRFVRRHFAILTALFLSPLNRYLATLISASPNTNVVDMGSFSEEDFLQSLATYGFSVPFKGKTSFQRHKNAEAFYRKFIRSPGFFTWLKMKMSLQTSDCGGPLTSAVAAAAAAAAVDVGKAAV